MSAALRRGRNACPPCNGLTVPREQDHGARLQEVSSLARAENSPRPHPHGGSDSCGATPWVVCSARQLSGSPGPDR